MKTATLSTEQMTDYLNTKEENARLKEAMVAIRFLAFKHEVQYWLDASGTTEEKMGSILTLAREANWGVKGRNRTSEIIKRHK